MRNVSSRKKEEHDLGPARYAAYLWYRQTTKEMFSNEGLIAKGKKERRRKAEFSPSIEVDFIDLF